MLCSLIGHHITSQEARFCGNQCFKLEARIPISMSHQSEVCYVCSFRQPFLSLKGFGDDPEAYGNMACQCPFQADILILCFGKIPHIQYVLGGWVQASECVCFVSSGICWAERVDHLTVQKKNQMQLPYYESIANATENKLQWALVYWAHMLFFCLPWISVFEMLRIGPRKSKRAQCQKNWTWAHCIVGFCRLLLSLLAKIMAHFLRYGTVYSMYMKHF